MKTAAIQALRRTLAADQPAFGLWVTLESPSITEMAVALGLDWVVIDAEHGHLDWKDIAEHLRATVRSETVALVRIAELNGGFIKRALDIGADGVVIPWIESAEQLAQAVRFAQYPLEGLRGIGAERATAWGQALVEHTGTANEHVLVVPIIETLKGAAELPALCQVPGVDVFWFGPADFSASAGYRGQWEGPGVAEEIVRLKDVLRHAGRTCGLLATSDSDLKQRVEQGFRMIGFGADAGLLIRSLRTSLKTVSRDRVMRADLSLPPNDAKTSAVAGAPVQTDKSQSNFNVAFTADFHDTNGQPRYRDIGRSLFDGTTIVTQTLAEHRSEIGSDQLRGVNGVIVLTPRVTTPSLSAASDLLAIGRFGVGYDSVDVSACTNADVLLFIATGAVDRSVAEATICWMLALSHRVRSKDRLVREGRWDERSQYLGTELRNRTLGVIGFGGIGRELLRLLAGFGMNPPLVYDPFVTPAAVCTAGAHPVSLTELLSKADFVSLHCPLTEQTRNLIGVRELSHMKPTAYLINTARGAIVNEAALELALRENQIAGAALDCFENEPLTAPSRLAEFENVLLAPHCIAWTDELFRDIGRSVCQGMIDLAAGRIPRGVVNREVFERATFQAKWKRLINSP
jgi:phosphoglycerate dehydrogenase-like enzyme/2-keto-3-deoxy-L-rhamnonate aldolase RhmA